MQSKTATVVLSTPKEKVFAYLANIENMPKWSTEFCKQLKTVDGRKLPRALARFGRFDNCDRFRGVKRIGEVLVELESCGVRPPPATTK